MLWSPSLRNKGHWLIPQTPAAHPGLHSDLVNAHCALTAASFPSLQVLAHKNRHTFLTLSYGFPPPLPR